MKKLTKITAAVCIALIIAVQTAFPAFSEFMQESNLTEIFAMSSESREADHFFDGLRYGESDWMALCCLRLYGTEGAEDYLKSVETAAEELLSSDGFIKPTEVQRMAIILSAAGRCSTELMNAAVYFNENLSRQGFNAYIFALIAAGMDTNPEPDGAVNTKQSLAEYILSRELEGGGWALFGEAADTDVTAMAIVALSPMKDQPEIKAALGRAEKALEQLQLKSGGYMSAGVENCESSAQAVMAYVALGYGENDPRVAAALEAISAYKRQEGYAHLPDGKADGLAAAQTAQAFTSLILLEKGERMYAPVKLAELPAEEQPSVSNPAPTAEEENPEIKPADEAAAVTGDTIKLIICGVFSLAGIVAIVAFLLKGRRNRTFLWGGVICIIAAGAVAFIDIRTPEEYYQKQPENTGITVTVSVECGTALANMDRIDPAINPPEVIPEDGIVLYPVAVTVPEGASAFDALAEAARQDRVRLDYSGTSYGVYISGIGYIYEFGFGANSGWLFRVNDVFPQSSSGAYEVKDGDRVEFLYSCNISDFNIDE